MQIHDVGMTRNHFQQGELSRIRMVVLHATAGRYPSDYNWLRQGGSLQTPVSIHYYIDKQGTISRMVADKDIAWHAGRSTWVVDGETIPYNIGCNNISLGIELENLNDGRDPYPQAQYDAALWLTRKLVADYNIPREYVVRHLDIAPQRKTDPRAFPWERFVADIYAVAETPAPPAEPTPPPSPVSPDPAPAEPVLPQQQLRAMLVDLAYRSAATSCPEGWALLNTAVSRHSGMPVAAITPCVSHEAHPDTQERAVALEAQPLLVLEAYGRDLFYAPPYDLGAVETLSSTADGLLRELILHALFRAADPANGFQPGWAFHQYYTGHMADLGPPIGPNYRLTRTTSDGRRYACQHFALDTLCSPVDDWKTIIRLSDLTHDMYTDDAHSAAERELRTLLLNDLYQQRTGRTFDFSALFCQYAITQRLGAPIGKAEYIHIGEHTLVGMAFALDTIYCRVPADGDWRSVKVFDMPEMLGADPQPYIGRLSALLAAENADTAPQVLGPNGGHAAMPAPPVYSGALVGSNHKAPLRADLSLHAANDIPRRDAAPDIAIVYPTTRPASIDLMQARAAESPPWHYYIDRLGVISQLLDEAQLARAVQGARWNGQNNLEQRSLAVAIEGHMQGMAPRQQEALVALLGELMRRHHLKRQQVLAASALCPEEPAASPAAVAPDAAPATAWHGYQQDASLTYAEVGGG